MLNAGDFQIQELGERRFESPLKRWATAEHSPVRFIPDEVRVPLEIEVVPGRAHRPELSFEKAGPRERLYFHPESTTAAIVTCGGLCPGLNNVIRAIVMQLHHGYGVRNVLGLRYGYKGLDPAFGLEPMPLGPDVVSDIHDQGGTILGTSRGPRDPAVMVDFLRSRGINILFAIGGDGTQRGAHAIHVEAARQGYPLAVVGAPKTIDNDIPYIWSTFGFATAIETARDVIDCAHNEARGQINGVGLVKLMGREAGFIAAGATLASGEVNFTLIPEIPFRLEGDGGFLPVLCERLRRRGHAVVVVAEGAGQDLLRSGPTARDVSGNIRFADIGLFLADAIRDYSHRAGDTVEMKYFDPSYYIRSAPANCHDSLFCEQLARNAVHAAMAGKTNLVIGLWYNLMTHVPSSMIVRGKKHVSEDSEIWQSVLKSTGQPPRFGV